MMTIYTFYDFFVNCDHFSVNFGPFFQYLYPVTYGFLLLLSVQLKNILGMVWVNFMKK